jgi:hypothetical protein
MWRVLVAAPDRRPYADLRYDDEGYAEHVAATARWMGLVATVVRER